MRQNVRYHIFSPLFTPSFDFHQQHLTAIGDSCIDEYLSSLLLKYCLQTNAVLSANTARQWNSVFHNHLALRFLASELQFTELAIPLSQDFQVQSTHPRAQQKTNTATDKERLHSEECSSSVERMHQCIQQLQARYIGPSKRDVAGTSFSSMRMLPCGQSPLGWKLSHFIGALHLVFGPAAVRRTLNTIYDLERGTNVMEAAVRFLLRLLKVYPALSVVESLLAAQGLRVRYVGQSRLVPESAEHQTCTLSSRHDPTRDPSSSLSILSLAGFGVSHTEVRHSICGADNVVEKQRMAPGSSVERSSPAEPGILHTDSRQKVENRLLPASEHASRLSRTALSSPSALEDPDQLHLIQEWRQRAALVVRQHASVESEKGKTPALSLNQDQLASLANPLEGWLSHEEQWAAQSGPAFWNAVDVAAHSSFADRYGVSDPIQGKVVSRVKFKCQVRDPMFYDNLSDMRKGIPLDTEGMGSTENLLHVLQHPHRRIFGVTMLIESSADAKPKEIGKVTAWRYSVARDAASKAFLTGVIRDLHQTHFTSP